jgi:hypothetical protein
MKHTHATLGVADSDKLPRLTIASAWRHLRSFDDGADKFVRDIARGVESAARVAFADELVELRI